MSPVLIYKMSYVGEDRVQGLALLLLRAHARAGSASRKSQLVCRREEHTGNAEIAQIGPAVCIAENIAHLQVARHDPHLMSVAECVCHLKHGTENLGRLFAAIATDVPPVDVLHGDETAEFSPVEIEHPDDVRMSQPARLATLPAKERNNLFGRLGRDEFGDHVFVQLMVPNQPDLAHAAFAEGTNERKALTE